MSAENDLAALQENFSFGKSRYIRNDKAAMTMRSAQRSSTYNAISFQQECTETFSVAVDEHVDHLLAWGGLP
jgi:hypothetical protein